MAIYERICRTCGRNFKGGPRAWYCPDCRKEREKERARKYAKGGFKRHLGDKDICKNCGKEYIVESGLQKYCSECQPIMYKKLDNEQGTAYYHNVVSKDKEGRKNKRRVHYSEHKDEINAKRREEYNTQEDYAALDKSELTIKELRTRAKMTQAEFADYFQIPLPDIQHWETKYRNPPRYLIKLIEYRLLKENENIEISGIKERLSQISGIGSKRLEEIMSVIESFLAEKE